MKILNFKDKVSQPKASIGDMFPHQSSIYGVPYGGMKYIVNLTDDFDVPHSFDEVIALLANATEDDEITWNIVSAGGYIDSLEMLLAWKEMCAAKQTHVLTSSAASAATAFFLSPADQYLVFDTASFMIHESNYGSGGTASNVRRHTEHVDKKNDKFIRSTYKDFLNESEIEDVLKGVEIYLDADAIRERLTLREQKRMEQAQEEVAQQMKEFEEMEFDYNELSIEELEEELQMYTEDMKKIRKAITSKKKESEAVASSPKSATKKGVNNKALPVNEKVPPVKDL